MSLPPLRFAAVDVGTNSVLLTIAEKAISSTFQVISQSVTITRLGQGVDRCGRLHPEAEARTLACFRKYREEMARSGVERGRALGTSALRDAEGTRAFLEEAKSILGFEIEVVSGKQEAELTFQGALHGLNLKGPAFVFDIGGGSTELIVGNGQNGQITQSESLDLGCVRLSERAPLSNPPTTAELKLLREQVRESLSTSLVQVPSHCQVVGVAGTVTTLAAIDASMEEYKPELIHGRTLSTEAVQEITLRLSHMNNDERARLPGLSAGRRDVIVAGAILCEEILRHAKSSTLLVSDRGLRFALLLSLASERN